MPTKKESTPVKGEIIPAKPLNPNTRRAMRNKALNQQVIRERLANQGHVSEVIRCIKELDKMESNLKRRKTKLRDDEVQKIMMRTGILTKAIQARMKLISKYLPDLRSIDFQDKDGDNPFAKAAKAWVEALEK